MLKLSNSSARFHKMRWRLIDAASKRISKYLMWRVKPETSFRQASKFRWLCYGLGLITVVAMAIYMAWAQDNIEINASLFLMALFVLTAVAFGHLPPLALNHAHTKRLSVVLREQGIHASPDIQFNQLDRWLIDWLFDPARVALRKRQGLAGYIQRTQRQSDRPKI